MSILTGYFGLQGVMNEPLENNIFDNGSCCMLLLQPKSYYFVIYIISRDIPMPRTASHALKVE